MLILLIVAFVLNCEPAFPPAGSGLFGFVEAADFVNADEYDPTKDVDLHKNDMIDAKDEV